MSGIGCETEGGRGGGWNDEVARFGGPTGGGGGASKAGAARLGGLDPN
jgi:hypothetical protein